MTREYGDVLPLTLQLLAKCSIAWLKKKNTGWPSVAAESNFKQEEAR